MTAFDDACLKAARSFLQTVVLLDDRAAFKGTEGGTADLGDVPDDLGPLVDPDTESGTPQSDATSHDTSPPYVAPPTTKPAALGRAPGGGLDAGVVTRGFAAHGLVCAVLRPDTGDTLDRETSIAAARADIVVLDWEMQDRGAKATNIIRTLIADDVGEGDRLRLVVVYTGANPLRSVFDSLMKDIDGLSLPAGTGRGKLTLENAKRTLRLIMLAKASAPNAPQERSFAVSEDALPQRLIHEFAEFAGGLLPNATLATIAALRQHTHRILARLDKTLDGPLITHRALVGPDGDTEQFVASVIMEELQSQVPLALISREYTGAESIHDYFEHKMASGLRPKVLMDKEMTKKVELSLEDVKNISSNGVEGLAKQIGVATAEMHQDAAKAYTDAIRVSMHKRLYLLTGEEIAKKREEHERFALITGMKRDTTRMDQSEKEGLPILRLGVVLQCEGKFWVCLTPLCDGVRIPDAGATFLLAELKVSSSDWNVMVNVDGKNVKLLANRKRQVVRSIFFGPSTDKLIKATVEAGSAFFTDVPEDETAAPKRFRWLGEMKPMQAQRIVQSFSSNLSRVGLDEFEWQRLQAPPP